MACHKQAGETWRFFESDPDVIRGAWDPRGFTFVSKCQPDIDIDLGEPRQTLAKQPDCRFDLLIVDKL